MQTWEVMRNIAKREIESNGVKQKFLAQRCGFSERDFSLLLNGRAPITDDRIVKFCKGMGVTPNELFGHNEKDSA